MIFKAEGITFSYRKGVRILDGLSLYVHQGERVGIVGYSGSGKSTLARCLAGLLPLETGTLRLNGKVLSLRGKENERYFRQNVQMVFQDPFLSLPQHLPLKVPLFDACRLRKKTKRQCSAVLSSLLKELRLPLETLDRSPDSISGGQRQRVAIARAVIVVPKMLILDEVTSALDLLTQNRLIDLLERLREKRNMGIILISHDIDLVLSCCNRILVLDNGRIVEEGTPKMIEAYPKHHVTRLLLNSIPAKHPSDRRLVISM